MSGITNWSEALADPCFWAWHYAFHLEQYAYVGDLLESFFGPAHRCEAYGRLLFGDEDFETPLPPGADYVTPPASVLTLSFPEDYTWALEFGEGEVHHQIYHPQRYGARYPEGVLLAVVGGHFLLPGLRWAEVKQMVACLQSAWPGTFDLQTLYPLLYPIVDPVTLAEYDEVRQTLGTAWEALHLREPFQLERWLDASIRVYEQGRLLHYQAAHGWQDPFGNVSDGDVSEEKLWLADRAGDWFCDGRYSTRRYGSHDIFVPFFEMLARHTQPHT